MTFRDDSIQKAGKTILAGVNLNILFGSEGSVRPYFSVGAGVLSVSEAPLISWTYHQAYSASDFAEYSLDLSYVTKMSFLFNAGAGLKIYLAPNMGLKIEGRGHLAMFAIDKAIETDFSRSGGWTVYTPYSGTALTEKGTPFFATGLIGFFIGL